MKLLDLKAGRTDDERSFVKDQKVVITGGTGSFGSTFAESLLRKGVSQISILSRDEWKQEQLRDLLRDERLRFYIGDTRDFGSLVAAFKGADHVFHAAALKQVPSCEFFPMEAVKTNILGTSNVLEAAMQAGLRSVVCLSTDKAVYPINAMGQSKALMEKVAIAKSAEAKRAGLTISVTRYGNVMASRGSVIPRFVEQVRSGVPITVTDAKMTRFLMNLGESVDLVEFALESNLPGHIYVRKAPAATLGTLAEAVRRKMGKPDHPIVQIGFRHGEKRHEALLSSEEMSKSVDRGGYFLVPPDDRGLMYESFETLGTERSENINQYDSENTERLDVNQVMQLLSALDLEAFES